MLGPPTIRSEGGKLVGFVFVDTDRPIADYVKDAKLAVGREVKLPAGTRLEWVGQFKYFERAKERLKWLIPLTLAKRLRPRLMTVATMILGLVPVLWSAGTGADVMRRIAAPMIGGLVTSFLELTIYPAIFAIWKGRALAGAYTATTAPLLSE